MNRLASLVKLVVEELGAKDPDLVSSALFLALYTERIGDTVVLDPIERGIRRSLRIELVDYVPRSHVVSKLIDQVSSLRMPELDPRLEKRVRESVALIKELGIEGVKNVVKQLFGPVPQRVDLEDLVRAVRIVREEVDELLDNLDAVGEVHGEAEAV